MSVRAFSAALDTPASTTRNYLDKGTKPSTDYIERIAEHFNTVNLHWLITGQGEHFLFTNPQNPSTNIDAKKISRSQVINSNKGKAMINADDNEKDLAAAQREIELLRQQLTMAQALLEAKEETLALLRGGHNRPNWIERY